jgi:hypothetical protein
MAIVFIHEDIIYLISLAIRTSKEGHLSALLFCASRGAKLLGAKVKVCGCELCGSRRRTPAGSPDDIERGWSNGGEDEAFVG